MSEPIRCAVVGYGPEFNMGKRHGEWIEAAEGLKLVGVCDINPERLEAAKRDFPHVETFEGLDEMLERLDFDLAVIVTPHNTHAPLALKCIEAGKHVVVEKPMCVTVDEATRMIEAAKERGVTLTVFQNRRWDGDFLAIKEAVEGGAIGRVFRVEMFIGGYGRPRDWWRSDKEVSGGLFLDWGAHMLDWLLGIVRSKVKGVAGYAHKLVWRHTTIEDHVGALIYFEDGTVADVQISTIAALRKPRWAIWGTKGAIVSTSPQDIRLLRADESGNVEEERLEPKPSDWGAFYRNLAAHLLEGEELAVKPEEARRNIAIMEAAMKSARTGKVEPVPFE